MHLGWQLRDAAKTLLKTLVGLFGRLHIIWADGGYLGSLVQRVNELRPFGKLHLEIVRRCDRSLGFKVLPKRWIIERTFGWLTKSRRLGRDYGVRLDHSEAMIRICLIRLMVRRLASIKTTLSDCAALTSHPKPDKWPSSGQAKIFQVIFNPPKVVQYAYLQILMNGASGRT
ncbi:MAG: transposase [Verrucomicrobiota bacterium]